MKEDLKGIEEIESMLLRCADCSKRLAEVSLIESNKTRVENNEKPIKLRVQVKECYNCGGSSFPSKVFEGKVIVGSLKDEIELSYQDMTNDIMVFTTKRKKAG